MKVLVTGSSGLIGSALMPFLGAGGHEPVRLVRSKPSDGSPNVFWNPESGEVDSTRLEGLDAVVHLAGENITGKWTSAKKTRIRDSRINGTRTLCEALAGLARPPRVLISASATGYYGDRGTETLYEDSSVGQGFLADVCRAWEAAADPAVNAGIRVVYLRLGMVLSPSAGALAQMLSPFGLGLGGRIGSGRQYWSWITLDDVIGAIHHALTTEVLEGPVNAVSPCPVTNLEFTRTLGRVLSRPTLLRLPAFATRLAVGEMADEVLLASTRVEPAQLRGTGYRFRHSNLEDALYRLLQR
jgi:uncharacterized protein (TIGR01777 family)